MARDNDSTNSVGIVAIVVIVLIAAGLGYYLFMASPKVVSTTEPTKVESTTISTPANTTTTETKITN